MDTDESLGVVAAVSIAVCGMCIAYAAWKSSRGWQRATLKPSRSDTDLTSILDNAVPSGSAMTVRKLTPPDDPTSVPSEERYA